MFLVQVRGCVRGLVLALTLLALLVAPAPVAATRLKLSGDLAAGQNVGNWQISRDSRYVVYSLDTATTHDLYSVPLVGGTPVKLNTLKAQIWTDGVGVATNQTYQITADSTWVIYTAINGTTVELYRAPIDRAGESVKLSAEIVAGGYVRGFGVSPDGQYVVYAADQAAPGVVELYSVRLDSPGAAVKLNPALVTNGDIYTLFTLGGMTLGFFISPDSSRVVYLADQETDERLELYSVPIAGPAAAGVKLNGILQAAGNVSTISMPRISPDSSRVVYTADQETDNLHELYSVPIAGPAAAGVKLNVPLSLSNPIFFQFSPDSSRVVYVGAGLHSVPVAGPASANVELNASSPPSGFSFAAEARVIYMTDQVYSVPLTGPADARVSLNTSAKPWLMSGDRRRLVFAENGLTSVPVEGPASAGVQIATGSFSDSSLFFLVRTSPDGLRIVYNSSDLFLFSAPILGPYTDTVTIAAPSEMDGEMPYYRSFEFSPDGRRVVYRADAGPGTPLELWVTDEGFLGPAFSLYLPLVNR